MSLPLIEMKNIEKSFGGVKALKGVDLTIFPGEIHCLAGENGCGKSTLIKVLSGVHKPDSGEIYIEGEKHNYLATIGAIKKGIQVIYQDFSIFPNLTVAENIALSKLKSENKYLLNWRQVKKVAKEALGKIKIDLDLDEKLENMSVADKQLVAIARALVQDARLIIMDEPTTALTYKEVENLFKVIQDLKKDNISILFVSHKMEEIFAISEQITVLRNGNNVVSEKARDLNVGKLVFHMTGRNLSEKYFKYTKVSDVPLLDVKKLGLTHIFEDINFSIFPGEIVGLTGLLGSGRTELAEAIFGIYPYDKGEILVDGKLVKIKTVNDAINAGIVYVPEDRLTEGLFLEHSIENNIVASTINKYLKNFKVVDYDKIKGKVDNWVQTLGIVTTDPKKPVQTLSGGNQQKVVISKWLSNKPKLLILNGPTVGVDNHPGLSMQ